MDEAIALLFLAPVLIFGLWLADFTGRSAMADGRAQLAAFAAAAAAAEKMDRAGNAQHHINNATRDARDTAVTAMLGACREIGRGLATVMFVDEEGAAWTWRTWRQSPAGTVLNEVRVKVKCLITPAPFFNRLRTGEAAVSIRRPDSPTPVPTGKRPLGTSGG